MSDLKFMLAKEFMKGGKIDPKGFFMSEKFDGYRACYDHSLFRNVKSITSDDTFL